MYRVFFLNLRYYFILQTHLSHTSLVWAVLYILELTVKSKISSMLKNWIRDGEPNNNLRGPRHGMSGDKSVPYRP